jgi:malonyl-CoA O-methyltransferase
MSYDRWSTFYDTYPNPTVAVDELTFPPLWRDRLRGGRVLEIGCGTGRHTRKLVSAGNRVLGIDPSAGMLAVAREKVPEATFVEADFLTCDGIEPGAFDAALASLVLEHLPDLPAFFRRVAAALKAPGAELYLSEIHPVRTAEGTFAHFKDEATHEEIRLVSYPHTAEQIEAAAGGAGFRVVERRDVVGDETLAGLHPKWSRYLGQPMIQLWQLRLESQ